MGSHLHGHVCMMVQILLTCLCTKTAIFTVTVVVEIENVLMMNHVLFPISVKTRIRSIHKNSLNEAVTTSPHNACPKAEARKMMCNPFVSG